MVDRPIKKSDRPNPPVDSDSTSKPAEVSSKKSRSQGGDKGKRDSKRDEPRAPENLALMRGPKPSKTPPPVVKEAVSEVTDDASTAATDES